METCPRCKENMPVLSKICPVCGYVNEEDKSTLTPSEFANALENKLFEIKNIPEPSFLKSMGQLTFIIFPLLAIYMIVLALISEAGLFWILFLLFAIFSIVALVKKSKGTLGNDKFNKQFNMLKHALEYYKRLALRDYGKSKEVSKLVNEIEGIVQDIESRRKKSSARNTIVWITILVITGLAAGSGAFKLGSTLKQVEKQVEQAVGVGNDSWKTAIESLKAMSESDPGIEQKRIDITKAILSANDPQAAEAFFIEYCMGARMDFECASLIVKYYLDSSEKDVAKTFVDKCSKMRYRSDIKKLSTLIE